MTTPNGPTGPQQNPHGAVTKTMPTTSPEGAKSAAEQFVAYIAADDRIKSMLGGW
ncbi:hypothetical protein ACFY04_22030 [Streptomyces sp. NPDC001549]|uniref:hypothetical protein n=1 Tax=Streptomyces sp. NPDC001549 TaxID=3364586 RepID=UPI003687CD65